MSTKKKVPPLSEIKPQDSNSGILNVSRLLYMKICSFRCKNYEFFLFFTAFTKRYTTTHTHQTLTHRDTHTHTYTGRHTEQDTENYTPNHTPTQSDIDTHPQPYINPHKQTHAQILNLSYINTLFYKQCFFSTQAQIDFPKIGLTLLPEKRCF